MTDKITEYPRIDINEIAKLIEADGGITKTENEIRGLLKANRDFIRSPFAEFGIRYNIFNRKIIGDVLDYTEDDDITDEGRIGMMITLTMPHEPSGGYIINYYVYEDGKIQVQCFEDLEKPPLEGDKADLVYYFSLPVIYAVILMHCKNVVLKDKPLQKYRGREDREPKEKYKILDIRSFRELVKYESGNELEHSGIKKSLHICRGHLRTYDEIKPLFGKYTGTFYIPAHVRGDKKFGVTHKHYRVLKATSI